MNAVPRTSSAAMEQWNKRMYEDDVSVSSPSPKRARYSYYVRLESESSTLASESEESVLTIQDHETEEAQDTPDTDSKSESSDYDVEVEYEVERVEYEVASLSESDLPFGDCLSTTSGVSDDAAVLDVALEDVVAAVLADSSLEAWAYDTAQSSSSSSSASSSEEGRNGAPPGADRRGADFSACAQCRRPNDVPRFRLCTSCFQHRYCWCCRMIKDKTCFPLCSTCYQVRKKFYPPRPRRARKQQRTPDPSAPETHKPSATASETSMEPQAPSINIEKLKSCLEGISSSSSQETPTSQDSGVGSSQELPPLGLDQIVIPSRAIEGSRKRYHEKEEEDVEEEVEVEEDRRDGVGVGVGPSKDATTTATTTNAALEAPEFKDICIVCTERSISSAFLHGASAHACCCYRCAMRCWKAQKRCPICQRKVRNVIKLFKS